MNANEHLDFYNPDSIYYANSRHYIQQLENKVRQQQAEIADKKLVNDTFADLIKKQGKKIEEQQAEIAALKEALSMKVILNEQAQQAMKEYKELLK